jgi:hypothetical protein
MNNEFRVGQQMKISANVRVRGMVMSNYYHGQDWCNKRTAGLRQVKKTIVISFLGLLPAVLPMFAAGARGYIWNDRLTGSGSTAGSYQFNSFGGINTVKNLATGKYVVNLPGLGMSGGTVHVTAYGGNHYCKTDHWHSLATTLPVMQVFVNCFGPSGTPVNGLFTLLFYEESRLGTENENAYLWANNPVAVNYKPAFAYQWNSKNLTNTVSRLRIGSYQATLPGLTPAGGTVLVTAYGSGPERCKVGGWGRAASGVVVNVFCFDVNGIPTDALFTLSFMTDMIAGGDWPFVGAFTWADLPYTQSYTPALTYQFNQAEYTMGSAITIQHSTTGAYKTSLPSQPPSNKTVALVSAYGTTSDYCNIGSWTPSAGQPAGTAINVMCYDRYGMPVDTLYVLQYLTNARPSSQVFICSKDACFCNKGKVGDCSNNWVADCADKALDQFTCVDSCCFCYTGDRDKRDRLALANCAGI